MDLIHNRLQERGFKGLSTNPLSSALESTLKNTVHEDDHDPRKAKIKAAKQAAARKRRRLSHSASKGIKVDNQYHFKPAEFTHAAIVEKYHNKVAAKADAARKAALVAAATGGSFSWEPVKKAVTPPPKPKIQPQIYRVRRPRAKRVKKKSLHFTHSYHHPDLDIFDSVHQKILAEHRKSNAINFKDALNSHMFKSPVQSRNEIIPPAPSKKELTEKQSSPLDKILKNEMTGGVRRRSTMKEADFNGITQSEFELRKGENRKRRLRKSGKKLDGADSAERLDSSRRIKFLMRNTHFTETEIVGLTKIFKLITERNNPPGEMDRKHFRSYFQTTFGITDDIMLDQLFHHFDEDNVGSIREHMWIKNLSCMIMGSMTEQVNFSYEVYDLNGDGSLGREEIKTMLQGCIRELKGANDDDGVPMTDAEIVEIILKKMDPTRIGYINKEAFRSAVEKDPTLIQAFGEVLPPSEKLRTFMIIISDAMLSDFQENYSWPGECGFPKERGRYDAQKSYKGQTMDPLRKQLANVNRQIVKYSQQQKRSNQAMRKPGVSLKRSIRFQPGGANK